MAGAVCRVIGRKQRGLQGRPLCRLVEGGQRVGAGGRCVLVKDNPAKQPEAAKSLGAAGSSCGIRIGTSLSRMSRVPGVGGKRPRV